MKPRCPARLHAGVGTSRTGLPGGAAQPRRWDWRFPPGCPPGSPPPAVPAGARRCRSFPPPSARPRPPAGQQTASPPVSIGAALASSALGRVLRTLRLSRVAPLHPLPPEKDALPLGTASGPEVAPCRSRAPDLVSCRTAATAAGGTRSASPAPPGSSRTAGGITAASPACPAPSSTASRSPTAQRQPTPSAGNACRGEWGQILAPAELRGWNLGACWEGTDRGGFLGGHPADGA